MFKELDPLKRVEEIQALFNDHLKKSDFLSITREGVTYYSTQDTLNKERKIRQLVKSGDHKSWSLDIKTVPSLLQGVDISTLKNDQRQSLYHSLGTSNQFCGIIGDAGSGKTYMLKQLKEICDKNNILVRGMAFTGNAVEVMSKDSGIAATTIHRFLNEMEKVSCQNLGIERVIPPDGEIRNTWNLEGLKDDNAKELWVFDEASMVNNTLAYNVFYSANKVGAKVVLIGDPKQLDSIGTGDPFSNLVKDGYLDASRMSEVFRQKEIWNVYDSKRLNQVEIDVIKDMARSKNSVAVFHEDKINEADRASFDRQEEIQTNHNRISICIDSSLKKGVEKLAAGDIDSSLEYLDKKVEVIENSSERHLTIANDFTKNYNEKDFDSIITTSTNKERKELTTFIRDRLKEKGILSDEKAYTVINIKGDNEELCFAKNERIMCLSNAPSLGLNNGTKGTIKDINHDTGDVILEIEGSNKQISLNLKGYQNVTHAYAVTTYKSQGMSIKDVFVNFDASNKNFSYRNNAYVSVSRAKENLKIYTNDKDQLKKAFSAEKTKISLEDFTEQYSYNKVGQKFRIKKGFETDFLYKNQVKVLANKVSASLTNSIKRGFEKAEDLLSKANGYFKDFLSEARKDISKGKDPDRDLLKTTHDDVSSSLGRDVTANSGYDVGADLSRLDSLATKNNRLQGDQAIDSHLPGINSSPNVSIRNVTGIGM
jgi:ATP-dependent exoDNAse (exonuclease V) alpha subunit